MATTSPDRPTPSKLLRRAGCRRCFFCERLVGKIWGPSASALPLQIRSVLDQGFHGIRLDPAAMDHPGSVARAVETLKDGSSVILYSALEPNDRIEVRDRPALGSAMGAILRDVIEQSGVTRVIVAGGDTSSHAAQQLGLTGLQFSAPLVRGAPLCRAYGWAGDLELF